MDHRIQGVSYQRISEPIHHQSAKRFVSVVLCPLTLGPVLATPDQVEGGTYAIDLCLSALIKLEEAMHLVDKDIDGVILQLGQADPAGKEPEVHQVWPRHPSLFVCHAQLSVIGENGVVIDPLQEVCQRVDRVRRQCQLFLLGVALLLDLGQCHATEIRLAGEERTVNEDVVVGTGNLDLDHPIQRTGVIGQLRYCLVPNITILKVHSLDIIQLTQKA